MRPTTPTPTNRPITHFLKYCLYSPILYVYSKRHHYSSGQQGSNKTQELYQSLNPYHDCMKKSYHHAHAFRIQVFRSPPDKVFISKILICENNRSQQDNTLRRPQGVVSRNMAIPHPSTLYIYLVERGL